MISIRPIRFFSLIAAPLILGLLLSGCEPTIAKRGNTVDMDDLKIIKIDTTTREAVAKILGTPTQMSTFDDRTWYYIGRRTEQTAFFEPDLVEQKIIAIRFNPEGVVEKISAGSDTYAQNIEPASGKTPTYGKEVSVMQQLLGNLGKPSIPKAK